MCDYPNREAAMTVLSPGIWCDPCLAPLIGALNDGGLPTIASCCGHGHRPSAIMLADGRQLFVLPDSKSAGAFSDHIHSLVGCKPGRECMACASEETR